VEQHLGKCPCGECLIKPICRQTIYVDLVRECTIISNYLGFYGPETIPKHRKSVIKLFFALKPSKWVIGKMKPEGFQIDAHSRRVHADFIRRYENIGISEIRWIKGGEWIEDYKYKE
jgi:hypothetical protein